MTYQELMDSARRLARESSSGNIGDALLLDYIRNAHVKHMAFLEGRLTDYRPHDPVSPVMDADTIDIESRLEPFLTTALVRLTNGKGTLPDIWTKPRTVATSAYRHKCGTESTDLDRRYPVTWKGPTEFYAKTSSPYHPINSEPIWRHDGDGRIQVSPVTVTAVEVTYYKRPPYPAPADTIPWKDKDILALMAYVLRDLGVTYDVPFLIENGMIMQNREV